MKKTLTRAATVTATTALLAGAAVAVAEMPSTASPSAKTAKSVTVVEGDTAIVTLTLKKPAKHRTKVNWKTLNGTAKAGSDYTKVKKGRLIFQRGETEKVIAVTTLDDSIVEPSEYFYVKFSAGHVLKVKNPKVKVTITDNDTASASPSVSTSPSISTSPSPTSSTTP